MNYIFIHRLKTVILLKLFVYRMPSQTILLKFGNCLNLGKYSQIIQSSHRCHSNHCRVSQLLFSSVGELGVSGTGGLWHHCTWWTLREFSQRPGPQSSIGLRLERSFHLQISAKYKYRDFLSSDLFNYRYKVDFFSKERRPNHSR